mmetsp:Transcript_64363/g.112307  ORF Transcript_64363/g.112307 Transcript_64363/m.112307 type:complete len:402 (-) Transcript_64363:108-1313(-)
MEFRQRAVSIKVLLTAPVVYLSVAVGRTTDHGNPTIRPNVFNAPMDSDWPHDLSRPDDFFSLLQLRVQRQEQDVKVIQAPPVISQNTPVLQDRKVVWISSFPRSGSSLLLQLLEQVDIPVFGLFEPCKPDKDVLEPWLADKGCGALLSQLAHCDFTGVKWLWGWSSPYSILNGAGGKYSVEGASQACKAASLVVFKTIAWGHDLPAEAIPFLEANPQVQMIDLVRDPRSIYGSFLNTWGFKDAMPLGNGEELFRFCDFMYGNMNTSHSRLTRVVYEEFVEKPFTTAMDLFSFIGVRPSTVISNISSFVRDNFDNDDCDDDSYSNCRTNTTEPVQRYTALPNETYTAYMNRESCRAVSFHYGYNPWYPFNADPAHSFMRLPSVNQIALWWAPTPFTRPAEPF